MAEESVTDTRPIFISAISNYSVFVSKGGTDTEDIVSTRPHTISPIFESITNSVGLQIDRNGIAHWFEPTEPDICRDYTGGGHIQN